jgi:chromosome segregation ATPase
MALKSLKLLEERINGFLARHEQIQHEKASLAKRLSEKEQAYRLLLERLQQYEREREEIRNRLEKILSRFESLDLE